MCAAYFTTYWRDNHDSVWFPDNIVRRERALQLFNDIAYIQGEAAKARADIQDAGEFRSMIVIVAT